MIIIEIAAGLFVAGIALNLLGGLFSLIGQGLDRIDHPRAKRRPY